MFLYFILHENFKGLFRYRSKILHIAPAGNRSLWKEINGEKSIVFSFNALIFIDQKFNFREQMFVSLVSINVTELPTHPLALLSNKV